GWLALRNALGDRSGSGGSGLLLRHLQLQLNLDAGRVASWLTLRDALHGRSRWLISSDANGIAHGRTLRNALRSGNWGGRLRDLEIRGHRNRRWH
ncbi:hypothetical protein PFISCL1PPCAC_5452, partial [Pristionchus fissidentatus]